MILKIEAAGPAATALIEAARDVFALPREDETVEGYLDRKANEGYPPRARDLYDGPWREEPTGWLVRTGTSGRWVACWRRGAMPVEARLRFPARSPYQAGSRFYYRGEPEGPAGSQHAARDVLNRMTPAMRALVRVTIAVPGGGRATMSGAEAHGALHLLREAEELRERARELEDAAHAVADRATRVEGRRARGRRPRRPRPEVIAALRPRKEAP